MNEQGKGVLTVRLGALARNFRRLAAASAPARVAAVVKADAYGLGAVRASDALYQAGCRDFFVAHLDEAQQIRPVLAADARIYVLNGVVDGAERSCAEAGIIPVINSLEQARRWIVATRDLSPLPPAALQVDSGMARLGLGQAEISELVAAGSTEGTLRIALIMTHLACADDPSDPANAAQLARFERIASQLPAAPLSIANSGGAWLGPEYRMDLVRAGIALYGCRPNERADRAIEPVLTLTAPVIQLRDLPASAGIGYGLTGRASSPRRVATLAIGYADGWPRRLGNCGAIYRGEMRLPIVGRISMDSLTVDVTALPQDAPEPGEQLELIGAHQSLEDVARDADTIPYEILTRLGRRFARHWEFA